MNLKLQQKIYIVMILGKMIILLRNGYQYVKLLIHHMVKFHTTTFKISK